MKTRKELVYLYSRINGVEKEQKAPIKRQELVYLFTRIDGVEKERMTPISGRGMEENRAFSRAIGLPVREVGNV
ncbi:MAG: hypothetical protein PHC50_03510 [Candidatus Cloacimonetes bacterium]|nr:hypothetical protein [Candidatus Cloacimonadota bacterium]